MSRAPSSFELFHRYVVFDGEDVPEYEDEAHYIVLSKTRPDGTSCLCKHQRDALKAIKRWFPLKSRWEPHPPPAAPALIELPTGSGKTGILVLAPYLLKAKRTLILTPSPDVTRQVAVDWRGAQDVDDAKPPFMVKRELVTTAFWESPTGMRPADSVVALSSNTLKKALSTHSSLVISNAHKFHGNTALGKPGEAPSADAMLAAFPKSFFDLVIVDEAHHFPARTWQNVVRYFSEAKTIFLTATAKNMPSAQLKSLREKVRSDYDDLPQVPCYSMTHDEAVRMEIIRETSFVNVSYEPQPTKKSAEDTLKDPLKDQMADDLAAMVHL